MKTHLLSLFIGIILAAPSVFAHNCTCVNDDDSSSNSSTDTLTLILNLGAILVLVAFSGLFSGLTLGLLGLDLIGLKIVMEGGSEEEKKYAEIIYPVRKNGNLLLCTLLLGNVAVNALLSILLADLTSGLVGFLASTILIVIFGEILPQASCSRYALFIGAKAVPIVKVIMVFLYVFAKPIRFVFLIFFSILIFIKFFFNILCLFLYIMIILVLY